MGPPLMARHCDGRGCMLWNPEPGGLLFQAVAGVASTQAGAQGCLETGLPTWSLTQPLDLSLAIKDILDTIICGRQVQCICT